MHVVYGLLWVPREEAACGRTGIVRPVSAPHLCLQLWDLTPFSMPPGPLCVLCKMGDWSQLSLEDAQVPGALWDVFLVVVCNVHWNKETRTVLCRHPSPAWGMRLIYVEVSVQMLIRVNHIDWVLEIYQTPPSAFFSFQLYKTPVKKIQGPSSIHRELRLTVSITDRKSYGSQIWRWIGASPLFCRVYFLSFYLPPGIMFSWVIVHSKNSSTREKGNHRTLLGEL